MLPFLRKKKDEEQGPSLDEMREKRLDEIKQLVERFTYDLGLLISGNTVSFEEYMTSNAALKLRQGVEPFLATGDAMRPNFGEYGELRLEGNILDFTDILKAHIEFDDQSVRETADGDLLPTERRHVEIILDIDPGGQSIRDFSMTSSTK